MRNNPIQLWGSPRCGARARTRGGAPCQAPAVRGKKRCRMHGGSRGTGAPPGEANGMFKHGRFTKQAKQVSKFFRQMAKDGEAMVAKTLNAHGLRRKIPARIRRRVHVRKALAAAKAKAKETVK
jgi:hypothetical protein